MVLAERDLRRSLGEWSVLARDGRGSKGDRRAPGSMAGSLAKSEASEPRRAPSVIYLGPLKPEHRHWPAVQTFPIELVRQAVDEREKREGKVRLDEMD